MRLLEIRLLEGPNVYRLVPVVRVEIAVGRARQPRNAVGAALVNLARGVAVAEWPDAVADVVAWTRRLMADAGEHGGPVCVHRAPNPGHWIVEWPWTGAERARTIAEAAADLARRPVAPGRRVRLTATQARAVERWSARIAAASANPPGWIRDADRQVPVVSVTGPDDASTVTRLITHVLRRAGRHVGTATSDGILVDERLVEEGDRSGPGGAATVLRRPDIDVAVLQTARGFLVRRGIGYESNDASVFTGISPAHLDAGEIRTLPELAEVKSTVCRITRPDGWAILNADDALVAAVARRVRCRVALFALDPDRRPPVRRHLAAGGRAYGVRDGSLVELEGTGVRPIVRVPDVPVTLAGQSRDGVASALAAAGGARALGATIEQVADGLRDFRP